MSVFLRYIPSGLLVLLLLLMLRNRAYKVCPCFFAYVAFGVGADVARFTVDSYTQAYKAVYWVTEAGYCVLGILAMYEVFRAVLRARVWWTYLIFPAIVIVGVGLSLARACAVPPQVSGLFLYIVTGEIAVRFVQVLIFLGLGALVSFFGLRWRQYPLGIAAGFGLYSTVALLSTIKFSDFGTRFRFLFNLSSLVAYSLAVLIWIWFFRAPQKEEPLLDPKLVAHYTSVLEQYLNWIRRMR
jgi:Na+-transporting methylmalonyl-CoA/oxaloacetate decarboxylase beta subunit